MNQLWGNAMLLRLFTEFALGLKVNAVQKTISLNPRIGERTGPVSMGLRAGGKEGVLKLGAGGSRAKCSLPGFRVKLESDEF